MDISKYFLDGPVEQPKFDPYFKNFIKVFEFEKGLASTNIAICHQGIKTKTLIYNFGLMSFGLNYEDVEDNDVDIVFSLRVRSLGLGEIDYNFEEFKETLRDSCRNSKADAFFIDGHISEADEANDRFMENFALYYFLKNDREGTTSKDAMDIYENKPSDEILRSLLQKTDHKKYD